MCHPEVPAGQRVPDVAREEVGVPVADGDEMPALICRPESGTGPGVLVICDIFGRSPFYEALGARLATAGFVAAVPEIFFREGPLPERTQEAAFERRGKLDDLRALRDLNACIEWLKADSGASPAPTGTLGFCMGGTMSLQLAAERDDLITACYYGFPAQRRSEEGPPAPLEVADRITGPILGFWGDQDEAVGMENVEALAKALDQHGVEFDHTVYPGLGHGFLAASQLDPDHEAYEAACEAWTRTIEFFRARLAAA